MYGEMVVGRKICYFRKSKKRAAIGNYQKSFDLLEQIFDIEDYFTAFEYAKILYFLKQYEKAIDIFLTLNEKNKEDRNVIDFIIKCYKENNNNSTYNFFGLSRI